MRVRTVQSCVFILILMLFTDSIYRKTSMAAQTAPPQRGTFRVTLNGFRVNNESDDDILEGDGRGDEIFITANIWAISSDGTAHELGGKQTKVMGDDRWRPQRILAWSGIPN